MKYEIEYKMEVMGSIKIEAESDKAAEDYFFNEISAIKLLDGSSDSNLDVVELYKLEEVE